jgi:rRNA-processing protein FCF1
MPTLLCDTDFLIKVTNEPVPQLRASLQSSGFTLATLPIIERELKGLQRSKINSTARKARLALQSIGKSIQVIKSGKPGSNADADLQLLDFEEISPADVVIATLDGNLLSKLEKKRLPYFTLRKDRPFFRQFSRATYLTTKKP